MQQLTSYFIGMFVGVAGIKIGEFLYFIYSKIKKKEKERRSNVIDMIELQSTVNMLENRSVMQADAFNKRLKQNSERISKLESRLNARNYTR